MANNFYVLHLLNDYHIFIYQVQNHDYLRLLFYIYRVTSLEIDRIFIVSFYVSIL